MLKVESYRVPRQNAAERLKIAKAFVKFCMGELTVLTNGDYKEMSNRTQLCLTTLRHLKHGQVSSYVRFDTLLKLGKAVGATIKWDYVSK